MMLGKLLYLVSILTSISWSAISIHEWIGNIDESFASLILNILGSAMIFVTGLLLRFFFTPMLGYDDLN